MRASPREAKGRTALRLPGLAPGPGMKGPGLVVGVLVVPRAVPDVLRRGDRLGAKDVPPSATRFCEPAYPAATYPCTDKAPRRLWRVRPLPSPVVVAPLWVRGAAAGGRPGGWGMFGGGWLECEPSESYPRHRRPPFPGGRLGDLSPLILYDGGRKPRCRGGACRRPLCFPALYDLPAKEACVGGFSSDCGAGP